MFIGIPQSAYKFESETLSRQLVKSALRKQQMTSSFRRGAKREINGRNAGKLSICVNVQKQLPEMFYKKSWS